MASDIQSTGYMIQDKQGNAIFAVGPDVDTTWAKVLADAGPFFDAYGQEKPDDTAFLEDFCVYGATKALMDQVRDEGGAIAWRVIRGVACTVEEYEATSE